MKTKINLLIGKGQIAAVKIFHFAKENYPKHKKIILPSLWVLSLIISLAVFGLFSSAPSPEKTFKTFAKAINEDNYKIVYDCLLEKNMQDFETDMKNYFKYLFEANKSADSEKAREIKALLDYSGKKFFSESLRVFTKNKEFLQESVKDYQIVKTTFQDNLAYLTLKYPNRPKEEHIPFIKDGSDWKINLQFR